MKRPLAVALALAVAAPLFLLGCGKDNPVKPEEGTPQPIVYPVRSTPANALRYMILAFTNRDSVRTDSVYADDYEGTSVDLTDVGGSTSLQFSKSDEVRIVGALALSSSIIYVSVNFGPPETWSQTHDASDPPDWVTIQVPSFRIDIADAQGYELTAGSPAAGESWIFEFTLRPTADDTWSIARWVESRDNL